MDREAKTRIVLGPMYPCLFMKYGPLIEMLIQIEFFVMPMIFESLPITMQLSNAYLCSTFLVSGTKKKRESIIHP
jgi:hypothetical protein